MVAPLDVVAAADRYTYAAGWSGPKTLGIPAGPVLDGAGAAMDVFPTFLTLAESWRAGIDQRWSREWEVRAAGSATAYTAGV